MPVTDVPLVGGSISFDTLTVRVTEFDMEGVLQFDKGGTMTLEITATIGNEKDTPVPGVRIDLGELEIALQDLLALKPGEVIALGPLDPMACHLRVGSSVIARGELRQGEEGAVISITHVS
jgi:flagellar motor switch/type III secretory pathway protein FliN